MTGAAGVVAAKHQGDHAVAVLQQRGRSGRCRLEPVQRIPYPGHTRQRRADHLIGAAQPGQVARRMRRDRIRAHLRRARRRRIPERAIPCSSSCRDAGSGTPSRTATYVSTTCRRRTATTWSAESSRMVAPSQVEDHRTGRRRARPDPWPVGQSRVRPPAPRQSHRDAARRPHLRPRSGSAAFRRMR